MKRSNVNGSRARKAKTAALCLLACFVGSLSLHADDRTHASSRLEISVLVMPTLIASAQAQRLSQPSHAAVTYDLQSGDRKVAAFSVHQLTVASKVGGRPEVAVLKTATVVPE
jgi:hypothetical protein